MSHQLTFADSEFSSKRRQTRKEIFLSRMEQILPWQNMVEVIEPFYPKAGNWSGNGVHVESELVFMIGRNMQFKALFPVFSEISPTDVSFGPPETGWPA